MPSTSPDKELGAPGLELLWRKMRTFSFQETQESMLPSPHLTPMLRGRSYWGHQILLEGAVSASPATMPKGRALAPWLHSWPLADPLSCRPQLPGPCGECGGDCQGPICRRRMSHIPAIQHPIPPPSHSSGASLRCLFIYL